jgi:hypothetical protein
MKHIHAALAVTLLTLVATALLVRADRAVYQTAGGHEHHDKATESAAGEKSKATSPTPSADGKTVSLPGVPPGKLAIGGGVTTTITGEVMDPACFLEAGVKSIGKGHFQCAVDCARSGQTLAIYDRELDRIYFVAGELPGRNPNDPLIQFIHQKVDVIGTVYHRSQAWGVVIVKVSPHKPKAAANTATNSAAK